MPCKYMGKCPYGVEKCPDYVESAPKRVCPNYKCQYNDNEGNCSMREDIEHCNMLRSV